MMNMLQKSFLAGVALVIFGSSYAMSPDDIAKRRELAARAAEQRLQRAQNPNIQESGTQTGSVVQESGAQTERVTVQHVGAQTENVVQEEEQSCAICLEGTQTDNPLQQTLCGHFFHFQCLDQARQANNSCPACRSKPALFAGTEGQKYLEWVAQRIPANQQPSLEQLMRRTPSPQAVAAPQAASQPVAQPSQGRSVRDVIQFDGIRMHINSRFGGALTLDLSRKGLTSLEGLAEVPGIEEVEVLLLSGNQLTEIPANAFRGLGNLKSLMLNNNNLRTIANGAFRGLNNLKSLYLYENNIAEISSAQVFGGLHELELLGLSKNQLTQIPARAFQYLISLNNLTLSDNPISEVHNNAFIGLGSLRALFLGNSRLTREDKARVIQQLNMQFNNLQYDL